MPTLLEESLPALYSTLGEVVGCNRESEINVAFQSALCGVAIVQTWQEIRRESNQESLAKEQEINYCQKKLSKTHYLPLAASLIMFILKSFS